MRTIVFKVPERDLEALVTLGLDGGPTLAFRPTYGSWGPPIPARSDTEDLEPNFTADDLYRVAESTTALGATSDLDRFHDSLDEMTPGEVESATVYDATIKECPLCGGDLATQWDHSVKLCTNCGATIRNGLVPS